MNQARFAVPFLALLALAPAQDAAFRFAPKDATLVLRMGAPARWKKDFADTAMAKMMSAPALAPMMDMMGKAMEQAMAGMRGSGFDADLVERMLADYQGDFTLSIAVDWAKADLVTMDGEDPSLPFAITVAAAPHASFDLAALATAIDGGVRKLLEEPGAPKTKEVPAGELRLTAVADEDGMWGTIPAIVDGHLVMFYGTDVEAQATKAIEGKDRFEAADAGNTPMFVHADLRGFVTAMDQGVAEIEEMGGAPFDMGELLDAIGLRSLQDFRMTLGADGKHLVSDVQLGLRADKRGLMAMLPQSSAQPKLLRALPAATSNWTIMPLDLGVLYTSAEQIVTMLEAEMPMSWPDMMTAMAEELKVRLKEDLLDHLGGELMALSDASEIADEDEAGNPANPLAAINGQCMVLSLRDGAAFGKSVETMLRARGLHAARKTEEYQGAKVHRMTLAGVLELEYAITDDMLLLALGRSESARASLRGVLDAKASGTATELPAAVKAHLDAAPAGWCGVGVTRPADTMMGIGQAMVGLVAMSGGGEADQLGMVADVLQALAGEMKRLGVDTSVGFLYSGPKGVGYRLRW
ncbi:MAG: hypothetical protein ACK5S5_13990 [Planctomycetota bacterium]|jgi:hypothetical protein